MRFDRSELERYVDVLFAAKPGSLFFPDSDEIGKCGPLINATYLLKCDPLHSKLAFDILASHARSEGCRIRLQSRLINHFTFALYPLFRHVSSNEPHHKNSEPQTDDQRESSLHFVNDFSKDHQDTGVSQSMLLDNGT